jgi:zinc/manganese transport system substrate-binding protein
VLRRALLAVCFTALVGGCASAPASRGAGVHVVAAENFWGSIAAQLGGAKATVTSVIVDPNVDPHSYEPTAGDARDFAGADLAIVNGIGYDRWASQLVAANPVSGRLVLDAGTVLGLSDGDNPHQWYAPASVRRVVAAISADYEKLDPKDAAYFGARRRRFQNVSLARYDALRATIRDEFAGTPVGYSESIFEPLGRSLGLHLVTPPGFAKAVAEGTEVSAGDEQTVEEQARRHEIAVWVYNSQNETPEVQRVNTICRAEGIPIVTVTETLAPASASFEQWQSTQLGGLLAALRRAR